MRLGSSLLLSSAGWASALTQQCSGKAVNEGGNYFCGKVGHILYEGLRGNGKYDAVAAMDSKGTCAYVNKTYSGPLAPLDEGLSIHIRGPFHLKEAAVYTVSPNRKRSVAMSRRARGRRHRHRRAHQVGKRADMVTATINGVVVSWVNNYHGPGTEDPPPAAPILPTPPPVVHTIRVPQNPRPAASTNSQPMTSSASEEKPLVGDSNAEEEPHPHRPNSGSPGNSWDRIAYYNAESQVVKNMMFMGNYGGQGSGVFDNFGNSLAYLNADGTGGSGSSKTLKDVLLPCNKEFAIFSGEKCDESCGFSRARDIAYKGFTGANKVFLFRFSMPHDKAHGLNGDMPALWLLNARIPRTGQYDRCSCWVSKCGEADIFEVLAPGDTKCKSTLHVANGAGSSDWFRRPVDGFVTVAVVFHGESASISIRILPAETDFSKRLDDKTVRGWVHETHDTEKSSLFQLSVG
ncbi:putative TOS1-like glycosyl hydrolase [Hirsutella rhossiliensis]|uniref:glucan endo-1,3-beta-D-glucosidase n=1 Tax=Hirsutella rhossiliensis TaxID=111463 RepID=A0A9P8SHS6_9HYPO|nr:putative TOS1-like glycosyl hydrolase [Hirsutella rhossiliensis]KAH0962464.1 putative TOS1-like glycosyl hydrolase [Hirsutella rhossiliensis]